MDSAKDVDASFDNTLRPWPYFRESKRFPQCFNTVDMYAHYFDPYYGSDK